MLKKEVKGQSIIEFITLIGAMLFFFALIMLSINYQISDKRYEEEEITIRYIALSIQNELALGKQASDGYSRRFYIPEKINGEDYELIHDTQSNTISIRTERISTLYEVAQVSGSVFKGNNLIRKNNGIVYVSTSTCGNSIIDENEVCDGNSQSCSINGYQGTQTCNAQCTGFNACTTTQYCGDGIINGPETCDDGAQNGQPNKCNSQCTGITNSICGNGIVESGEQCDDGNTNNGDGCNSTCQYECVDSDGGINYYVRGSTFKATSNYTDYCTSSSNIMEFYCSNNTIQNIQSSCTNGCSQGKCVTICGNGIVESGEQCDDGNTNDNDCCSSSCQLDTGTTNMVGYWRGENNALDSLSINPGTLQNGIGFATGKVGQAFNLDGIDDRVRVADSSSLDITDEITIAAWVYPKSYGANNVVRIVHKDDASNAYALNLENRGGSYPINGIGFSIAGNYRVSSSNIITLNNWNHVVATYSKNTGQLKLYVNNINVGTFTENDPIGTNNNDVYIGNNALNTRGFDGRIDEVAIWNRSLTTQEVSDLYNYGVSGQTHCQSIGLSPPTTCGSVTGTGGTTYNEILDEGICGVKCSPASWIFKSNFCKGLNYSPKREYCYQGNNNINICVECIYNFNCGGGKICSYDKKCVNP
ncbi:MAG: LamG-like jellyroll fold domain-containing protein [Candidatus Pacearchaeota archaeon]